MRLHRGLALAVLVGSSITLLAGAIQAPELQVSKWLQAPPGFSGNWKELRGKVVVLEFWATWCEPCIYSMPHLNQLADEFRDKGVLFLAITDDTADRLRPFLAKRPMHAIIGIDPDRKEWKRFGVTSIPETILIGKDGGVVGSTLPENITSNVLRQALAGKKPSLPPKEGIASDEDWDEHIQWQDGVPPTMYAIIKPIVTTTSGTWERPGHFTADGVPLEVLVWAAFQTDSFHVDWQAPEDAHNYRAAFRVPEGRENGLYRYMQETLQTMFGIRAMWTEQVRDVYVLRRVEGQEAPPESRANKELMQMIRGEIHLENEPVSKLCKMLANSLRAVVLDETGLKGRYDFEIPYQPGQPAVTSDALKAMGLEALKAHRTVRMLVVRPDQPTKEQAHW